MNEFNETQLEVIRELAGSHYQKISGWPDYIPQDQIQKLEKDYADAIIQGLTDPDYWG